MASTTMQPGIIDEAAAAPAARLDRRGLIGYLIIAFGFTWLVDSVLYITGQGLATPGASLILAGSMFGPAIAAFVVTRWISPLPRVAARTGLGLGRKGSRWGLYWLAMWIGVPLLVAAALAVSAALGLYHADLTNFSAYRKALEATTGGQAVIAQVGIQLIVLVQLASLAVAPILNAIPTFGEEYGWRGYLLPALLPLGQWRALILDGVIWGLWHAPIIALGYDYPRHPYLGILFMCVFTTLFGIILGWTRLATGSVWPAVIGHGALNGSAGLVVLLAQANTTVDTALATVLGVVGWVVMLLVIGLLVLLRQLPVRHPATAPITGGAAPAAAAPAPPA